MFLNFLHFLITPQFWSKLGFFISYIITSLLVLEILRLVYTDANRKEVEKMLDSYSTSRNAFRRRRGETSKIPIEELVQRRSPSPAVTPEPERSLGNEQRRRRTVSVSKHTIPASPPASVPQAQPHTQTHTSPRRLRKRSDTTTSSSSTEHRGSVRRRREASPASLAGSKTSSRHASPTPKSKEMKVASSLQKMLRTRG